MGSLQGHFLVAAAHQLDPNFYKTVILVVEHTARGAFGVIVNRASEESGRPLKINSLGRLYPEKARPNFGGPVTGPLMVVHKKASRGERELLPGVFFSAKEENVRTLMWQAEEPLRTFAGYAGWGAQQLDYEIEQGVWRVVPATREQIFSAGGDLWELLTRQASRLQLRLMFHITHIPADPLLN